MTVSNLGICFAPTLMRGPDESTLSIMEIKYSNVVANTLIEDYDSIFNDPRMNQSQQPYIKPQLVRYIQSTQMNSFPLYPYSTNMLPYRTNKVITLYACVADADSELSFGPNEIITDGKYLMQTV